MKQDVTASSSQGGSTDSAPDIAAVKMAEDPAISSSKGGLADSLPGVPKGVEAPIETATRGLYLPPILRSHVIYPPPDGWIYWMSWNDIRVGDCTMLSPLLYLYPDAMVFFQASTVSSSSGDVWLMKGIQFYNGSHQPVGHPIPQHNGMNMAWEGSEYPLVFWDAIPGVTPSGAAQIRSATMTNHC